MEKLKPEIIYKISCIINSEFNYIPKVDLKEQYRIMDVKLICKRILEEASISKKEEEQLYKYLEERKYRLAFLAALNKIRTLGKFKIGKRSIIILGSAIKLIVDKLYKEKTYDFEMLRYLIIMCQTYFAIGNDGKEKIYLIKFIENSKYFKSEDLWNYYICEMIDREIDFQKELLKTKFIKEETFPEPFDIRDIHKKVDEMYYTTFENELMNAKEKQIIFDKNELLNSTKGRVKRRNYSSAQKIFNYVNYKKEKIEKNYLNKKQIREMNEDYINDITNKISKIASQEKNILRKKRKILK